LYVKNITNIKRSNSKRSNYEYETKKIRFDFYKEILAQEKCDYILLAHHKDDIVENIFANVCRGRYILDLAVIKEESTICDVKIMRPFIEFYKTAVYEFAHENQVPYFKDTTPEWSVRGKYRNRIYPEVESAFTKNVKDNLLGLSVQSYEWNKLVMMQIVEPFMKKVEFGENNVKFNVEEYYYYPRCFWNVVFMKIFYKYGKNCPSRKGIKTFMSMIPSIGYISLSNSCVCKAKTYEINIEFKISL
jgi:tRNA(Ile)-lysidine synthase TilS/MesJ